MRHLYASTATAALLASPLPAFAKCEQALVTSTLVSLSSSESNWQLAQLVDEQTYNARRSAAGASATIYGIPMGANYNQFRQNVSSRLNSTSSRWSSTQINNVLWTGLDPASASAYSACLNSEVFNQNGLHAAVVGSGTNNILIRVRWYVPGNLDTANVTWTAPQIGGSTLQSSFTQGDATISIPRPAETTVLAASYGGYTTAPLVLEPLPEPAPLEPTLTENIARGLKFVVVIDPSADLSTLNSGWDFSEQGRQPLSGGQIIAGQFIEAESSWISYFTTHAGKWCTGGACPAPGDPSNRSNGRVLRNIHPNNQEIIIAGHELTFNDMGDLYRGESIVGFIVVPRFELN